MAHSFIALFTTHTQPCVRLKPIKQQQREDTFDVFMEELSGYFCALLRFSAEEEDTALSGGSSGSSLFVELAHVWDFLLILTLHTKPHHSYSLYHEIRFSHQNPEAPPPQFFFRFFSPLSNLSGLAFSLSLCVCVTQTSEQVEQALRGTFHQTTVFTLLQRLGVSMPVSVGLQPPHQ